MDSDRKKKGTDMKNKILKKLMILGLVCSMSVSMVPVPALAAGTETESETKAKSAEKESDTKQTESPQSEAKQPETTKIPAKLPEIPQAVTEAPQSEAKQSETPQSETKEPETPQSETKQPEKPAEELLVVPGKTAREGESGTLQFSGGTAGTDYVYDESTGVITIKSGKEIVISGDGKEKEGQIVVEAAEAKISLENVILKNGNDSVLTVGEGKKLSLTVSGSNTLATGKSDTPAVKIEKEAELTVGGTGKLSIEGNGTGKDISMSRGNKKTAEDGKDEEVKKDKPSVLKITDGTVTMLEGISVTGNEEQKAAVWISGGSVDLKTPYDAEKIEITSDGANKVYKASVALSGENTQIDGMGVKSSGAAYEYGSKGIYTNDAKKIFLYLPAGKASVTVDGITYEGEVKADGAELPKAKAALSAASVVIPAVDYGYTGGTPTVVTIKNSGANSTSATVELTGEQKGNFDLTVPDNLTVPAHSGTADGENTEIRIQPKTGLAAGKYEAVLKISYADGDPLSVAVSFTVNKVKLKTQAEIDEKVYDGKRTASGTVTLTGAVGGEQPEIDADKVTFTFNSANVKDATTVTVSNLELKEEWTKNYELENTQFDVAVKDKIKKAPNDKEKADLKTPSVTTVYNSTKGIWQAQLTTYKGQEYLFFGSVRTSLTEENKASGNWVYGKASKTVNNRLVNLKSGGLTSGVTYTVWTRFAGDANHEPSEGELMTYSTFTVGQNNSGTGNGTTVNASDNKINGLVEGTTYKTGSRLAFGAVGAGMSNTSPKEGDERYLPVSWKVSEEHTWSSAPYEAAFTINQAGSYTLQVTFRKQIYSKPSNSTTGSWTDTTTTSISRVNFKMASTGANGTGYTTGSGTTGTGTSTGTGSSTSSGSSSGTAAKTGDQSPILPMAAVFLASAVVLAGYGWKRRLRTK